MKTSNKIWIALGTGFAIGTLLGVLFAPEKGADTRKKISDTSTKLSEQLKEKVQKSKEKLMAFKEDVKERIDALNEQAENII